MIQLIKHSKSSRLIVNKTVCTKSFLEKKITEKTLSFIYNMRINNP